MTLVFFLNRLAIGRARVTFCMGLFLGPITCDEVLPYMFLGPDYVIICSVPYHWTTYQILSPEPTCVIILSTIYSGVALLCSLSSALALFDSQCAARVRGLSCFSTCWRVQKLLLGFDRFCCGTCLARSLKTTL